MHYSLHGIVAISGHNWKAGSYNSYKRAIEAVKTRLSPLSYPVFAIVKRERACSIPLGITIGRTNDAIATIDRSLLFPSPFNPLNDEAIGREFWSKYDYMFNK